MCEENKVKYNQYKKENDECLKLFKMDLENAKLAEKTISKHMDNVEMFLNEYLLSEDPDPMQKGARMLHKYFGGYYIYEYLFATPGTVKTTAASIKKFYKSMLDHEKITKDDFDYLVLDIKQNMEDWMKMCEKFNESDDDDPYYLDQFF